jgi:hypothetical protein
MLHLYLGDAKFWRVLQLIDEETASAVQAQGCPYCGGVLHRGDYPRKPRGITRALLGEGYERRLSFCCARDGCRRRTTPESVRFLGRRVYPGALVVLVSALAQGLSAKRQALLCQTIGLSVRTLLRWRRWWREHFPATPWWRAGQGQFVAPPAPATLPGALLAHFGAGDSSEAMVNLLRWLSPMSVQAR